METGVPGLGTSSVTWPLRLPSTSYVHLMITASSMQRAISARVYLEGTQSFQRPEPLDLRVLTSELRSCQAGGHGHRQEEVHICSSALAFSSLTMTCSSSRLQCCSMLPSC